MIEKAVAEYLPLLIIFGAIIAIVGLVFAFQIAMLILRSRIEIRKPQPLDSSSLLQRDESLATLAKRAQDLSQRVANLEDILKERR